MGGGKERKKSLSQMGETIWNPYDQNSAPAIFYPVDIESHKMEKKKKKAHLAGKNIGRVCLEMMNWNVNLNSVGNGVTFLSRKPKKIPRKKAPKM